MLKPQASQSITIVVPLSEALRGWDAGLGREVVRRGIWQFRLARSSRSIVRSFAVRVTGILARSVATVALAPPALTLAPGQSLALRRRNPWLDGLSPQAYQSTGDPIVSAVRRDDSFVDLGRTPITYMSNRPTVLRVSAGGVVRAVARAWPR